MGFIDSVGLGPVVDDLRKEGKKIVLTNGCFDILHIGHVTYLEEAKKLGDTLIVGVNSDISVNALKHAGRPIVPAHERARLISSLRCVDYVVIFNEASPERLVKEIRPDIHVKGGDYTIDQIPESKLVKSLGGKEVILEQVEGVSTSNIIQKILSSFGKPCSGYDNTISKSSDANAIITTRHQKIINELEEHMDVHRSVTDNLTDTLIDATSMIVIAYKAGKKVLLIGNGGSAADAQHIAGEFMGRFRLKRRGLPAIALVESPVCLTALANDFGYEAVFATQIETLAVAGDILIAISTSGMSPNVLRGVEAARNKNVKTIGLTGGTGGELKGVVDLALIVPSSNIPRIQEAHATIGHIICGLVEEELFGEQSRISG